MQSVLEVRRQRAPSDPTHFMWLDCLDPVTIRLDGARPVHRSREMAKCLLAAICLAAIISAMLNAGQEGEIGRLSGPTSNSDYTHTETFEKLPAKVHDPDA